MGIGIWEVILFYVSFEDLYKNKLWHFRSNDNKNKIHT